MHTTEASILLKSMRTLRSRIFKDSSGQMRRKWCRRPGRVNLVGEHPDYNGGFVLPFAIERGIFVAARPRTDSQVRIWSSEQENEPASFDLSLPLQAGVPAWSNYVRGVLAGLQEERIPLPGFDAVIHASLPAGGGLSSSAALEVATATLGELLGGVAIDPIEKALLCQKAEHLFAGTPCGVMDQFAVVFGKRGHVLFDRLPLSGSAVGGHEGRGSFASDYQYDGETQFE